MAQATTHAYGYDSPEEALRQIQAERTRRSWIALILFVLATLAVAGSFYFSYRDVPAPSSPANNAPGLPEPYH
jgi:hypothetical protein